MASAHNSYGAPMKQDNSTLQSDSYAKQLALAVRVSGLLLESIFHWKVQVLTAARMKFRVFWDVAPCSHVDVYRRFRGEHCHHHHGDDSLMMGVVRISETSVNVKVTTRRYTPEDSKFHISLFVVTNQIIVAIPLEGQCGSNFLLRHAQILRTGRPQCYSLRYF
jgi:hypothetical protein